jgi:hypothetical protein
MEGFVGPMSAQRSILVGPCDMHNSVSLSTLQLLCQLCQQLENLKGPTVTRAEMLDVGNSSSFVSMLTTLHSDNLRSTPRCGVHVLLGRSIRNAAVRAAAGHSLAASWLARLDRRVLQAPRTRSAPAESRSSIERFPISLACPALPWRALPASGLDFRMNGPRHGSFGNKPSRCRVNERGPNVAQQLGNLGWLAVAGVPPPRKFVPGYRVYRQ